LTGMTKMANDVAKKIKRHGYQAKAISGSGGKTVEENGRKVQFGHISLKHAAELAGIGLITRNYLLTNLEYGNLLWLSAVLTDAKLIPDEKLEYDFCKDCNKCVEACPSGVLKDSALTDKKGCDKFYVIENKQFLIKCYSCRSVCPYSFNE